MAKYLKCLECEEIFPYNPRHEEELPRHGCAAKAAKLRADREREDAHGERVAAQLRGDAENQ